MRIGLTNCYIATIETRPEPTAIGTLSSSRRELHDAIADLARITVGPGRGVTREVFTPGYTEACERVSEMMRTAGMTVRTDAFGNLFGRLEGTDPGAPVVLTGSHIDTTLDAGAYDGVVGVLGAVAAVGDISASGQRPTRSIEVVAFAGEEPRFGFGCIGSRAMMGQLQRDDLDRMTDRDGVTLAQALRASGLDPDALESARWDPGDIHAFVELHIEQGAVLESEGVPLGVVRQIAAPHDLRVQINGKATHAGATPMRLRRDALAGAAEVISLLERLALDSPSDTIVATVGKASVLPGAINIVPGTVVLEVDVRDSVLPAREALIAQFLEELDAIAAGRSLSVDVSTITIDTPADCAAEIVAQVTAACAALGVPSRPMISGAYHDAMIIGRHAPMGMIFVPSRDGLSHHPDEYTSPEHIDIGVDVLRETLLGLASAPA